jgi:transcription elongation GreA/GreB family factor
VTETRDETVTWLTQEAYDRLKAELDYLSGEGRIDIAKKIEAARDEGDLRRTAVTTRPRTSRARSRRASSRSSTSWRTPGSAARRAPTAWSARA